MPRPHCLASAAARGPCAGALPSSSAAAGCSRPLLPCLPRPAPGLRQRLPSGPRPGRVPRDGGAVSGAGQKLAGGTALGGGRPVQGCLAAWLLGAALGRCRRPPPASAPAPPGSGVRPSVTSFNTLVAAASDGGSYAALLEVGHALQAAEPDVRACCLNAYLAGLAKVRAGCWPGGCRSGSRHRVLGGGRRRRGSPLTLPCPLPRSPAAAAGGAQRGGAGGVQRHGGARLCVPPHGLHLQHGDEPAHEGGRLRAGACRCCCGGSGCGGCGWASVGLRLRRVCRPPQNPNWAPSAPPAPPAPLPACPCLPPRCAPCLMT